jgi:phage terminase large subunit-like protein
VIARASDRKVNKPRQRKPSGWAATLAGMVERGAELLTGITGPDCPALVRPYEGCYYDAAAAERAVEFFGYLRHSKGKWAGQPFELSPWQARILRAVFGWMRPDGTRLIRTLYLEVPRKNGKSTFVAGVALYLTVADREPGAEIYGAATDREQASLVFEEATRMVEASPELSDVCTLYRTSIYVHDTHSSYKVLSRRPKTGFNNHGNIVDELHEFQNRHLWDAMTTGAGARRQPLTVAITTAGFDRNSICWQQHDYAEKVNLGIIEDPSFLGIIFAAGEKDDWTKEETWRKANPNFGVSVSIDFLRDEFKKARENPAQENVFKRFYLNIWTEQESRWLPVEVWDKCEGDGPISEEELAGRPCFGGLDLSNTTDIAALVWVFPITIDGVTSYDVLPRLWLPRESADRRSRNARVPYPAWAARGLITLTDGNVIDHEHIREQVLKDVGMFQVREVAYDPWNAVQLCAKLHGDDGVPMLEHRQGYQSMNSPVKSFETVLHQGRLRHGGHPVLRWAFSNIVVSQDPAGSLKLNKAKSFEKIDPMLALVMALGRAELLGDGGSVYDGRGLVVI